MTDDLGKPLALDRLLRDAGPWVRTLAFVLSYDRAGIGRLVRELCEDDAGAEALGAMVDNFEAQAERLEELARLLRLGFARVGLVTCELVDHPEAA